MDTIHEVVAIGTDIGCFNNGGSMSLRICEEPSVTPPLVNIVQRTKLITGQIGTVGSAAYINSL